MRCCTLQSCHSFWQIVEDYGTDCNAGPKAPRDVAGIATKMGAHGFHVDRPAFHGIVGRWVNRLLWFFKCRWYRWHLPNDVMLLMQYPSAAWSKTPSLRVLTEDIKKKKRLRVIALIHDLASFRQAGRAIDTCTLNDEEMDLFALADKVIAHNDTMVSMLKRCGISEEKLKSLELFDYLTEHKPAYAKTEDDRPRCSVVIAGNLDVAKSGYLSRLGEITDVDWHLYGSNFDQKRVVGSNIKYEGCWTPEELPAHLDGCFGLVWDGLDIDTCSGPYGEYLRVNNPHKLSLYLASGLPVIVWRQSAVASLVEAKGLGVAVDSLTEINSAVMKIDEAEWTRMKNNVDEVGENIRSGFFTSTAIDRCVNVTCPLK